MKSRHKRLMFVGIGVVGLGVVAALLLKAFNSNMVFFFSPTDVLAGKAPAERSFRLGGLVEKGTLTRSDDGLTVSFIVTDNAERIPVSYTGILPDLFREGQGVIAEGKLSNGKFTASEVLAKHDENYVAPEVAKALAKGQERADQKMATADKPVAGGGVQ